MGSDFSNYANSFLKNNSNYTSSSLKGELSQIANELYNRGRSITSIYTIDENTQMNKGDFTSLFAFATDNNIDEVNSDQVDLLYDILDYDQDGNLSYDELSVFADASGEITDFNMWQVVLNYSAGEYDKVETSSSTAANGSAETSASTATSGSTATDGSSSGSSNANSSTGTENSTPAGTTGTQNTSETEETEETENNEDDTDSDDNLANNTSTSLDLSDVNSIKSYVNQFINGTNNTPGKVIDWLVESEIISKSDADVMRKAFYDFSDEEYSMIQTFMANGKTFDEAVELLQKGGYVGEASSTLDKQVKVSSLSDAEIAAYADKLYNSMAIWGTKANDFNSVFNSNMPEEDLVAVLSYYNETYGSFLQDVEHDFTALTGQNKIMKKYAEILRHQIEAGNEQALDLMCNELYSALNENNSFKFILTAFFNDGQFGADNLIDEKLIAKMSQRYLELTGTWLDSAVGNYSTNNNNAEGVLISLQQRIAKAHANNK